MIFFSSRWICGRMKQIRRVCIVLGLVAALIFLLSGRNLKPNLTEDNVDLRKAFDSVSEIHATFANANKDHRSQLDSTHGNILLSPPGGRLKSTSPAVYPTAHNNNSNSTLKTRPNPLKPFETKMTGQEKAVVFQILQVLEKVSQKYGFTYFLCGGTLLGSYRHHDLIPWDDDVDIYMNITERDDIYTVLDALWPKFSVFSAGNRLKLYSEFSHRTSSFPWDFPYVDINFYMENSTHIIDSDPLFERMAYRKQTIFPLHRRPLGGMSAYAPYDTYSYLIVTYVDLSLCSTSTYDHRSEKYLGSTAIEYIQCGRLRNVYPFVYRSVDPGSNGVRETLKVGDTELHTIVVEESQSIVGDLFRLNPVRRTKGKRQK